MLRDFFNAQPDRVTHVKPFGCLFKTILTLDCIIGAAVIFFTGDGSAAIIGRDIGAWILFNIFFLPILYVVLVALAYGSFLGKWWNNFKNRY